MSSKPVKNTKKSKGGFDGTYLFGFDIDISKLTFRREDHAEKLCSVPFPLASNFCVEHSDTAVREAFSCPLDMPKGTDDEEYLVGMMRENGRSGRPCVRHFEFRFHHDTNDWINCWIREQIEREPDWLFSKLPLNREVPISKAEEELKRAVLEFCKTNRDVLVRDGWYADLSWYYWYDGVKLMKPAKEIEDALLSQAYQQSGGFSDYDPQKVADSILRNETIRRNLLDNLMGRGF